MWPEWAQSQLVLFYVLPYQSQQCNDNMQPQTSLLKQKLTSAPEKRISFIFDRHKLESITCTSKQIGILNISELDFEFLYSRKFDIFCLHEEIFVVFFAKELGEFCF